MDGDEDVGRKLHTRRLELERGTHPRAKHGRHWRAQLQESLRDEREAAPAHLPVSEVPPPRSLLFAGCLQSAAASGAVVETQAGPARARVLRRRKLRCSTVEEGMAEVGKDEKQGQVCVPGAARVPAAHFETQM